MAGRIGTPSKIQVKRWAKLKQGKYRRQEGLFLAEGAKVVGELIRSGRPLAALLVRGEADPQEMLPAGIPAGTAIYRLTPGEWSALSQDASPEGVMAVAVAPPQVDLETLLAKQSGPLLLLYQVSNPNNLGALLRTAHWFGFRTVLLGEGSCDAANPKVVRTSMGSLFHLAVAEGVDLERLLPELRVRFRIIGSDVREGIAPHACPAATALLLGSESRGLPGPFLSLTDERWRIPGGGEAESLSLPQAAAIMMYECVRQTGR